MKTPSLLIKTSTDELWPLIVLGGFIFFVSLVPLPPNDFWWHLKIGEIISSQKVIPTTNIFSWSLPADQPFVYGAWLGEFLLYLLYKVGHLELVIFTRNLLIGITVWLVAVETKRRSGSWRIGGLAIALVAAMTLNNLVVRPQIWSWLVCIIYFVVLSRYVDQQIHALWLLICPILMVFWVNAHGAYILGGVILGIFFSGESIRTFLKLENALSWSQIRWILGIGILTGCAMFINPQGFNTIHYVIDLMTDQPSQSLIVEWQSPSTQGIPNITFYFTILILLGSLAYSKRKLTPTEFLLICGFTWLAWSGMRYILWYAIICMPILMTQVMNIPIPLPKLKPQVNFLNTVLILLIFFPAILVQPWFVESFPLPQKYWGLVQRNSPVGPLVDWDNPISATDYLQFHPGGRLFNEMGYGSYLIWANKPGTVFIDPRVELYPYEQWEDYVRITRAARYNQILEQYGVDRILLSKSLQPELATALKTDPAWEKEYEDQHAEIWRKSIGGH